MNNRLFFIMLMLFVMLSGCGTAPSLDADQSGTDGLPSSGLAASEKPEAPTQEPTGTSSAETPVAPVQEPSATASAETPVAPVQEPSASASAETPKAPNQEPADTAPPGTNPTSPAATAPDSSAATPEPVSEGEEVKDLPLAGKVIVLDPGHQSKMKQELIPIGPGATETRQDYAIGTRGVDSGVFEYEVVLSVAKKLQKVLEKKGAAVILTRESHDVLMSNRERAAIANDAQADAFVRIHCDGSDNPKAKGISVLYPGDAYIKDQDMLKDSLDLSKAILESVVAETGAGNRGLVKRNDLVGFNYCTVPCTLVEMGFMTNPDEDRLLNSEDYQVKLVEGIAEGILQYIATK